MQLSTNISVKGVYVLSETCFYIALYLIINIMIRSKIKH